MVPTLGIPGLRVGHGDIEIEKDLVYICRGGKYTWLMLIDLGCDQWDDKAARQKKNYFPDPEVVYCRYMAPDKNRSVLQLEQGPYSLAACDH